MNRRITKVTLAVLLASSLLGGLVVAVRSATAASSRTHLVAYFSDSNGIFAGDDVIVLGVPVGRIDSIVPEPSRVKISFSVDETYHVPVDVRAVILSPKLVTSRAIQLTPVYTGGPALSDGAVIPEDRTAIPVEWDDFRDQLDKLAQGLQPTTPGGVSPLGALITTAADNLRGQGAQMRDTLIHLSQAVSVLGDHSDDTFSTVKNLSTLVSALRDSSALMAQLNTNLATVSTLLDNTPNEVGNAVDALNTAVADVQGFVAENQQSLIATSEKSASVTTGVIDSLDDVKQTLHVLPNVLSNFVNIYEPAHGSVTGALSVNNFSNPIEFICGAIQAASRLDSEQSAKLCVQYLAPIVKNRQYNFPPFGLNPFVNAQARPNEVTYSEPSMRPDYVPAPTPSVAATAPATVSTAETGPTDLQGMLLPAERHP